MSFIFTSHYPSPLSLQNFICMVLEIRLDGYYKLEHIHLRLHLAGSKDSKFFFSKRLYTTFLLFQIKRPPFPTLPCPLLPLPKFKMRSKHVMLLLTPASVMLLTVSFRLRSLDNVFCNYRWNWFLKFSEVLP